MNESLSILPPPTDSAPRTPALRRTVQYQCQQTERLRAQPSLPDLRDEQESKQKRPKASCPLQPQPLLLTAIRPYVNGT